MRSKGEHRVGNGLARRSAGIFTIVATLIASVGAAVVVTASAPPAAADPIVFFPADGCQSYIVPANVGQVDIEAVGGDGFPGDGTGNAGGKGGLVKARFDVN